MENSKTDSLSSQNNSEIKFLQQIKECKNYIQYIEQIFFNLCKQSENNKQVKASQTSLNECNQLNSDTSVNLSLSQKDFEIKANIANNVFEIKNIAKSQNEVTINFQVDSLNNDKDMPQSTFVIQVPSSILDYVKDKTSNDQFLDTSTKTSLKNLLKSQRKTESLSLLHRIFKRKKKITSKADTKFSEKKEMMQFLKTPISNEKYIKLLPNSNKHNLNYRSLERSISNLGENLITENSTNSEIDHDSNNIKKTQTLIFPITYNSSEKSGINENTHFTIHHEIIPQNKSNSWSHSIKIINKTPNECLNTSDIIENENKCQSKKIVNSEKEELQSSDMILENLLETLLNSNKTLKNLDLLKTLLKNINEKQIKMETSIQKHKPLKNEDENVLNFLLEHLMDSTENKRKYLELLKTFLQIPQKQSSQLSICSSERSESSNEESYKSKVIIKPKYFQKQMRSHSSTMCDYLFSESERSIHRKR